MALWNGFLESWKWDLSSLLSKHLLCWPTTPHEGAASNSTTTLVEVCSIPSREKGDDRASSGVVAPDEVIMRSSRSGTIVAARNLAVLARAVVRFHVLAINGGGVEIPSSDRSLPNNQLNSPLAFRQICPSDTYHHLKYSIFLLDLGCIARTLVRVNSLGSVSAQAFTHPEAIYLLACANTISQPPLGAASTILDSGHVTQPSTVLENSPSYRLPPTTNHVLKVTAI